MKSGTLYIVATPIGNLADITLRALDVLRSVGLIAAEDTRHTRKLLSHYDIHKPLISYHHHNMHRRNSMLLDKISKGEDVALVTDAGTPGISDPGALLIQAAIESQLPVAIIPGPAALIMALISSGLPTHPFAFLGFPPKRGSERKRFFSSYASLPMTLIVYESPQRFQKTLEDMIVYWGNRKICVARELTKKFEETYRGTIVEAQEYYSLGVKGELTLVIEGAGTGQDHDAEMEGWQDELYYRLKELNHTVKDATREIVQKYKAPRREVYREAVKMKKGLN